MSDEKITLPPKKTEGSLNTNPHLSKEEMEAIKVEAAKEVEADFKKRESDALKNQYKLKMREDILASKRNNAKAAGDQQITIDLPEGYNDLRIDGEIFRANHTYFVTQAQKVTLVYMMFKVKEHFNETRLGKPARFFSVKRTRARQNL